MTMTSLKFISSFTAFTLLLLAPSISRADLTGKDLLDDCQMKLTVENNLKNTAISSPEAFQAGACTGYIKGFDDMEIIYASIIAGPSSNEKEVQKYSLYCLPAGISNTQMTKVVINYIKSHPKELGDDASIAVAKAFRDAYPCPK